MLIIGVLKEMQSETRVSLVPEIVATLAKNNITVFIEKDAGLLAFHSNQDYENAGAQIVSRQEVMSKASIIAVINAPEDLDAQFKGVLIGVYQPLFYPQILQKFAQQGVTVFSLDMLPRTTRAQAMDVLSSQANIAGYKAIVLAAAHYPRYFPMFMTAAGSIKPARVLILGAGVAGLQAIATARRLGAVVEVFDTRAAVKEEVMSLGAKFVEVEGAADASKAGGYAVEQTEEYQQKQKAKIAERAAQADIIITTAQLFGRKAPILITKEMIDNMKAGSIIVDIAASTGGNTELTKDNETVVYNHVSIIGNSYLPGTLPADASKLYAKNVYNFLQLIVNKEGELNLNFEDDLVQGACMCHQSAITNDRLKAICV